MRRLLIALVLILVIYVLGQIVFKEIRTYLNNASLIFSGVDQEALIATVRTHLNNDLLPQGEELDTNARYDIRTEYINNDQEKDVVVTVESEETCGTGGCVTAFYLLNEFGEYAPVNFVSAVKSLKLEPTITNGMHDIIINDDVENILRWDGQRYTTNGY